MTDGALDRFPAAPPTMTLGRYAVALLITLAAILSQYVVPGLVPSLRPVFANLGVGLAVVYGIPIAAFAALVGVAPLRRFGAELGRAGVEGLRWYGLFSLLGLLVTFVVIAVLLLADPSAVRTLESQTNPEIAAARSNPWFWIGFAFVIGAVEETIFRGWIFGFWLVRRYPNWLVPAVGSSALFAGVHLYYGATYGVGALALYPTLFLLGLAFAVAYRASGGNLVVVALLHGANDATAFLVIVSPWAAYGLHYGIILVGGIIATALYLRSRPSPPPPWPWGGAIGPLPIAAPYDGAGGPGPPVPPMSPMGGGPTPPDGR